MGNFLTKWRTSFLTSPAQKLKLTNINLILCAYPHSQNPDFYASLVEQSPKKFDCIIIDDQYRNRCAQSALRSIKKGGVIILDNANHASIGENNQPTFALLGRFEHHTFLQPWHPDWRTDYWLIDDPNR